MTTTLNPRIALVVGSTGATGSQLMQRLLASDHFSQIVIVHYRPTQWATHPKVSEYQITPDELNHFSGLPHIDEVFCCLGTTIRKAGSKQAFRKVDHDYVIALAQWMSANPQPRLHLISAYGANARSHAFYMQVKGEVEDTLKTMELDSLVIYQPSLLHGERNEFRPAEKVGFYALSLVACIPLSAIRRYRPTRISALAEAMFQQSLIERKPLTVMNPNDIAAFEQAA